LQVVLKFKKALFGRKLEILIRIAKCHFVFMVITDGFVGVA